MRWLSRRTPQAAPRGRHAAGQSTGPPAGKAVAFVASSVMPDPVPVEPPPQVLPEPASMPMPVTGSGIHLGFTDGSDLELTAGDPRVGAFRAVARTLVGG
jgi:hypothetical protein